MLKAILFDIGGTIIEEHRGFQILLEVQKEVLKHHGCDFSDEEFEKAVSFLISTFVPGLRRAVAWYFTKPDISKCDAVMRDINDAIPELLLKYPRSPYPAIDRVIESLSKKFVLALAANASSSIREDLERIGVLKFFKHQKVSQDIGFSKPDLRFFHYLLNLLGISADEAIMIGDRLDNDIIPARMIGMKAVWIRQGIYSVLEPRVPKEIPEATVTQVADIPAAVETMVNRR